MPSSPTISNPIAAPETQPQPPSFTRRSAENLSPFAFLGLWRNPFGELTPDERGELAVVPTAAMLAHLADIRSAIQIIGGCGFGKSTHLLALSRALPNSHYVYFPEDGPRPALPTQRPLLIDEGQRLSLWQRHRLMRSEGPLAIATHVDLSRSLRKSGFQIMTIDAEKPKEPHELAEILNRRIESSRFQNRQTGLCVAGCVTVSVDYASHLLQKFGSNVRRIEHHLYDEIQTSVSERSAWPPIR